MGLNRNKIFLLFVLMMGLNILTPTSAHAQSAEASDLIWDINEWEFVSVEDAKESLKEYPLANESIAGRKGRVYTLNAESIPQELRAKFEELDEARKVRFNVIRLGILRKFVAAMDVNAAPMGAAIVTKNRIFGMFKKQEKITGPIAELGRASIESTLNGLNLKLWTEAKKVADAKEVSFMLNPGTGIALGFPNRWHKGGTVGFSLFIGYVVESGNLFLTVNRTVEKLKSGLSLFGGIRMTYGLQFDTDPSLVKQTSTVKYPPFVPVWEGTSETRYAVGMSSSTSFPGDPSYFTNELTVTRLKKFELSTIGFWRVIYFSLATMGATDETLMKFSRKASVEFLPRTCPLLFY